MYSRPTPTPDVISSSFWEHSLRGVLAIQRCQACGNYQHPPRPYCSACRTSALVFSAVSGKGHLWSWTVTYHSVLGEFETALPYTNALVELVEQPGLLLPTDFIDQIEPSPPLRVGMPMRLTFSSDAAGSFALPQFIPII